MKATIILVILFAAVGWAMDAPGKAADFSLKDTSGKQVKLSDYQGKNVVLIFVATRCPYSNAFNGVMAQLAADYASKGVVFIGINSNKSESVEEVERHAKEKGLTFPILKDRENRIADLYGAHVTPESYLIDKSGIVRYHGALGASSRPTTNPEQANSNELRAALDELLAGKEVTKAKTKAFGCSIKRVS